MEQYIKSDEYNSSDFVPISKIRAISQAHNPRADKEDIALFLAYDNDQLIAYLGTLPDIVSTKQKIKVFWISCMWIMPEYRRHGIALKLLDHTYKTCKGNIFISNYIPRSKAAFIKTGKFFECKNFNGVRAYFRFDLARILSRKYSGLSKLKPLTQLADKILNSLNNLKLKLIISKVKPLYHYVFLDKIEPSLEDFIVPFLQTSIFKRSVPEFQWMMDYPWVSNTKDEENDYSKYYFSQYSKDFRQWYIRIDDNKNTTVGFMVLTLHKGELRIPYLFTGNLIVNDISKFLLLFLMKMKISTLISHNELLVKSISDLKKFFIGIRKSEYGFITTPVILQNQKLIFDGLMEGDGDRMFT